MNIIGNLELEEVSTRKNSENSYAALPPEKYRVMISRASYVATAAGTGFRIPLQLTIVGGDHNGRTIFEGLNVVNPNETAQQIGKQRLAEILDALGIERSDFSDTDQLEGGMLIAKVTRSRIKDAVQREKYGDDDGNQNGVARFFAEEGGDNKAAKKKKAKREMQQSDEDLDEAPF
jgi:hypothetical protein